LNWLGLDSPAVALAWTWAAGRSTGQELPGPIALGFFLFVWSIYLGDRLIDVARCPDWTSVPTRLRFGRQHVAWLRIAVILSLSGTVILAWSLPGDVLGRVVVAAPGVLAYFGLFVAPLPGRRKLPGKEFAIGAFCALPMWVAFGWRDSFRVMLPPYALLITLNCLVIASRERELDGKIDPGAATAWWMTLRRDIPLVGLGLAGVSLVLAMIFPEPAVFLRGIAAAALAMLALHLAAPRWPAERVRACADFGLWVPGCCVGVWLGT
jgi:hypothetical protein